MSLQRVVETLGLVIHSTLSESEGPGASRVTSPHFCPLWDPFPATPVGWGLRCGSSMASWCDGARGEAREGAGPSILGGCGRSTQSLPWPGAPASGEEGVGQCVGPRVTGPARLAWVGCRGPRRAAAALSAQLVFGKAPAGVQDGGERVGSQALCTRSSPLHPRHGGGEHQSRGLLASQLPPCPGPSAGRPPPARASLRSAPTQAAAENGCQSGASRHAAPGGGSAAVLHPAPRPL